MNTEQFWITVQANESLLEDLAKRFNLLSEFRFFVIRKNISELQKILCNIRNRMNTANEGFNLLEELCSVASE